MANALGKFRWHDL